MATLFESLLFLYGILLFLLTGAESSDEYNEKGIHKARLFVFGDSYADTGNINKSLGGPWKVPYGITFPGQPSGRFSDGRLLTDYIAKFLGLKSPIPYSQRKEDPAKVKHGVNFAFAGTGVTNITQATQQGLPNINSQIDLFQQILSGEDDVHINDNLTDSIALLSVVGNDYNAYLINGGTVEGLLPFIVEVVKLIDRSLQRILGLGFRRILMAGLQPLDCIPQITAASSFQNCNSSFTPAVLLHNTLLQRVVSNLNSRSKNDAIHILDLYNAFHDAFKEKDVSSGGLRFENALKPCCYGVNENSGCATVDENGTKLYTLCDDRTRAFFWDLYHPTQEGWKVVYPKLKPTIHKVVL